MEPPMARKEEETPAVQCTVAAAVPALMLGHATPALEGVFFLLEVGQRYMINECFV
jgi:hypothetical protein